MGLERYIGPNETLQLSFRMAVQYMIFKSLVVILVFGGIIMFFSQTLFSQIFATIGLVLLAYIWVVYYSTRYFVTETSVYKKTGILWRKVVTARKKEVTDIQVKQSFFERFLFVSGTIAFNTSGSPTIEIYLPLVSQPWTTKKKILAVWGI